MGFDATTKKSHLKVTYDCPRPASSKEEATVLVPRDRMWGEPDGSGHYGPTLYAKVTECPACGGTHVIEI